MLVSGLSLHQLAVCLLAAGLWSLITPAGRMLVSSWLVVSLYTSWPYAGQQLVSGLSLHQLAVCWSAAG